MPLPAAEDRSARLPSPPPQRLLVVPVDRARRMARSVARRARHLPTITLAVAFIVTPGLADAAVPPPPQVGIAAPLSNVPRDELRSTSAAPAAAFVRIAAPVSTDRTPLGGSACDAGDGRVRPEPGHRRLERDDAALPSSRAECPLAGPKRAPSVSGRTLQGTAAEPSTPVVAATPAPAPRPRWSGEFNLYRRAAFVTQKDFTWCVAASVQMMVNIVHHRSDRTAATQQRMIRYAQASDHGPWGPGGGTDVTGWIAALRHFGAGKYRALGARSAAAALRMAATAMRQTGRPAGMLVMDGRHAWVLHGFESRTDPRKDRHARITSVRVSGPLYPIQQKHGYDLRPDTELSVRALARFFTPSSVGALVGKYVVIVPVH